MTFGYDRSMPPLIEHLSIRIKPGEEVAFVGKSGCGKSSLLRLLLGFETPTEGYICYDHFNLQDINKSALRSHCVGAVLQNGRLIEGTQLDNIRFTAPKATDDEVWEALRLVALDEATSALDNVTQQRVAEHLSQMKCTRIMISQRPENLRHCDRIIQLTA